MKFLVGERRAVAAAVLAFYGFLYTLVAWSQPGETSPMFTAMAALYGLAFFGLVAGWFWGRWYATGLALFGLASGVLGMFQIGPEPVLVFFAVTHAVVAAAIAGEGMAAGFEGRTEWRTRFHLDDPAVERLGKSITRAAMTLPYLLLWALAPKQGSSALTVAPLVLGGLGLWAVVRLRTWGVLALLGSGATLGAAAVSGPTASSLPALVCAGVLVAAAAPFARPIARHLLTRDHLAGASR